MEPLIIHVNLPLYLSTTTIGDTENSINSNMYFLIPINTLQNRIENIQNIV